MERNLEQFGRLLGIAFQVADDLLDLVGDERLAGKSLGTDLEKEKATLPLIRLLSQCDDAERQTLVDLLHRGGPPARHALASRLQAGDGLSYTRSCAAAFARAARDTLAGIPWSPSRDVLAQLTELVITRAE